MYCVGELLAVGVVVVGSGRCHVPQGFDGTLLHFDWIGETDLAGAAAAVVGLRMQMMKL